MALHKFEIEYLEEISRDLKAAANWIDNIVKDDDLYCDNTLVCAACAGSYASSAERRIKVVIDAINIPEGELDPVPENLNNTG